MLKMRQTQTSPLQLESCAPSQAPLLTFTQGYIVDMVQVHFPSPHISLSMSVTH